jgi:hypothetical protein
MSTRYSEFPKKGMIKNPNIPKGVDEGYYMLANSIILMACRDYLHAKNGDIPYAESVMESTKEFFKSDMFRTFTNVDADWMIKKLDSLPSDYKFNLWLTDRTEEV